jgi:hypothetical protein
MEKVEIEKKGDLGKTVKVIQGLETSGNNNSYIQK